jgi:hypothetical protein
MIIGASGIGFMRQAMRCGADAGASRRVVTIRKSAFLARMSNADLVTGAEFPAPRGETAKEKDLCRQQLVRTLQGNAGRQSPLWHRCLIFR